MERENKSMNGQACMQMPVGSAISQTNLVTEEEARYRPTSNVFSYSG